MTNPMLSPFVMTMYVDAILVYKRLMQRFCSVNFIDPLFFVILILIV